MYQPRLTNEERELVDQLMALPDNRFRECMIELERHQWFVERKHDSENPKEYSNEVHLKQGRIKAQYYAWMQLATATLRLEEAKKHLNDVMENWDKMEHDPPIYWDHRKTADGWKTFLVGTAARDYSEGFDSSTGKSKLYLPHGEEC